MTEEHTGLGSNTTDDDTTDMSALTTTIEAAIDEHRRSQTQLRETISELETSIQEHAKSEQKLREILTHAEYIIDEFETELSKDYRTQEQGQGQPETEEQPPTVSQDSSSGESKAIDKPATSDSRRDSMLEELETLSADLDRLPEAAEIRQHTEYTKQQYDDKFDSYISACRESDIDLEHYILRDIESVAERLENIPTISEYHSEGRFSHSIIDSFFESWTSVKKALYQERSLSGFGEKSGSYHEELIHQLQRLGKNLDHLPSARDINNKTWLTHQDYIAEFGSIETAFEGCGFDVEQQILQDIHQVMIEVGQIPSVSQYDRLGDCSVSIVNNYFGSWGAAKKEFKQRQDQIEDQPRDTLKETTPPSSNRTKEEELNSDILDTIVKEIDDPTEQENG